VRRLAWTSRQARSRTRTTATNSKPTSRVASTDRPPPDGLTRRPAPGVTGYWAIGAEPPSLARDDSGAATNPTSAAGYRLAPAKRAVAAAPGRTLAARRGCFTNLRRAHWSLSDIGGLEKAARRRSPEVRPAQPWRCQVPQRPSQRAQPRFSQTGLRNSLRPIRRCQLSGTGRPLARKRASDGCPRRMQRKPMWLMPVSIICGRRAAGR